MANKRRKDTRKEGKRSQPDFFQITHEKNLRSAQIRPGEFPTTRIVAFIDIIGFSDLIERMFGAEPELFRILLGALEIAKSFADEPDPENVQAITAFSDSVVISIGGPPSFGMSGILATVHVLTGQLLKRGILCRGGIHEGRTYHSEGIVFGEGLLRAYDLEKNVANTPRIVIADHLAPSIHFLVDDPIPLLKRDPTDGKLFLNAFNYFWKRTDIMEARIVDGCWNGSLDTVGLVEARSHIIGALARAQTKTSREVEKVLWLIGEFNNTLEQLRLRRLLSDTDIIPIGPG